MNISSYHVPVLLTEVLDGLQIHPGKLYVDATLGGGGHTIAILQRGGRVLGIDQDGDALAYFLEQRIAGTQFQIGRDIIVERGNFSDIRALVARHTTEPVAGVVFDLGMSSHHINASGRGFSFNKDEPLDMRMDQREALTAAMVINKKNKEELYEIFSKYAEEIHSRAISHALVRARTVDGPLQRTGDISRIVGTIIPDARARQKTLARIFQAIRIVVNDEMNHLTMALREAIDILEPGGRIAVISYHSLEDRSVKLTYKAYQQQGRIRTVTRHPITPSEEEQQQNSRSRAAKLRIAEKL